MAARDEWIDESVSETETAVRTTRMESRSNQRISKIFLCGADHGVVQKYKYKNLHRKFMADQERAIARRMAISPRSQQRSPQRSRMFLNRQCDV